MPTPVIGAVGLVDQLSHCCRLTPNSGESLFLLGRTEGHFGGSALARQLNVATPSAPPPVDLAEEKRLGEKVLAAIHAGLVSACHDVSDGGVLMAIAEMALAGDIGLTLTDALDNPLWFAEDQGRYLLSTDQPEALRQALKPGDLLLLGQWEGDSIRMADGSSRTITALRAIHDSALPNYLA